MRRLSSGAILNFAPLRWIASIDPTLPHEVRKRLGDMFFSSTKPFFLGAANSTAVLSVAFYRIGDPVFLVIIALEVMLLVARLAAIRTAERSKAPFFVVGLTWALTQAFTISLVVLSRDIPMTIIVLASSLAAIGSIIGRNFAAPRYAMTQVLLLDLSFKASFSFLYPEFLPLILCQTVLFFLMNLTMIEQQRSVTVRAIIAEIESRAQSFRDPLTGLLNRRGMERAFESLTVDGARPSLLFLDLDNFKQVNDGHGHRVGDLLLEEVGRRLTSTIGPDAVACRLGGDEFLILCKERTVQGIENLGTRLIASLSAPYDIGSMGTAHVGASIGAALGGKDADLTEMMVLADKALYGAKGNGKGQCVLAT